MKPLRLIARATVTVVTLALVLPSAVPAAAQGSGCSATAGTTLAGCGFETPVLGDGNFTYGTIGSAWNFSPFSGISSNHSGFTGSQLAPEGVQVAFIQGPSSFSQSIGGFVDAVYTLTFSAARRLNNGGNQDFEVLLDTIPLGTFKPASTSYSDLSASFIATPGTHTLKFLGLDTAGGDNTAFIDNLRLVLNPGALKIEGTGIFAVTSDIVISTRLADGNVITVEEITTSSTDLLSGTAVSDVTNIVHPSGAHELHGTFVFTGRVAGVGAGTLVADVTDQGPSPGVFSGQITIISGTGDLARLRGVQFFSFPPPTYSVMFVVPQP
jgi:hypothetical protein